MLYAIEAGGHYIGDIDISIDRLKHNAVLSLFIGDRSQWGKGYGTETVELVLDALFSLEGVDAVYATTVQAVNERAHRFWQKMRFVPHERNPDWTTYIRHTD